MCEYEMNMCRNEEDMVMVIDFYKYLTLRKVNLKVKARFGYGGVNHS